MSAVLIKELLDTADLKSLTSTSTTTTILASTADNNRNFYSVISGIILKIMETSAVPFLSRKTNDPRRA